MHVLTAMQLAGEAGGFQVPGAGLGALFNMGGAAVANSGTTGATGTGGAGGQGGVAGSLTVVSGLACGGCLSGQADAGE